MSLFDCEGGCGMISHGGSLRRSDWVVDSVSLATGRRIIIQQHYSKGCSNTRTYLHGLLPAEELWESSCVGVAWWIPPTKTAAASLNPKNWQGVLSLSRLAIEPHAPKNSASFLLGASMRMIDRDRWPILVTYADEWQGHTGAIYKATNWREDGKTKPQRTYVRNGRMISRKCGPRTYTHREMIDNGAICVGSFRRIRFVHSVQ